eukprot:TRINITY_DN1610_c0_g2_i1.p1 TRINITY_DN1610_c0_g2~~TRINITY_DN1610_c0_g2_i1.p1  ORF type:complete len:746 (+),score=152.67 TRINITY_DN1610_c0_g2_i1:80-2317(+)
MEVGALDVNKLHPLWSLLLHSAKIGKQELTAVANVRWITRVVQQFLNQNNSKDLYDVFTDQLWPGLVEMLANSMKRQRKGGPEPSDVVDEPSSQIIEEYRRQKNKGDIEQNEFREDLKRQIAEADAKLEEVKKNKLAQLEQEAIEAQQRELNKLAAKSNSNNHVIEDDDVSTTADKKDDKYQILSEEAITEESRQTIEEIGTLLESISPSLNQDSTNARLLLRHAQWNIRLITAHLTSQTSKSERDKFLRDAGIKIDEQETKPKSETKECLICMDDFEYTPNPKLHLVCGHFPIYCNSCWREYLEVQLMELGQASVSSTQCMSPGCRSVVTESIFKHFVSPDKFKRYQSYQVRSFIEENPHVKWCPGPGCSYCVRLSDSYFDKQFPKEEEEQKDNKKTVPVTPTPIQPQIPQIQPPPERRVNRLANVFGAFRRITPTNIIQPIIKLTREEVQEEMAQSKGQGAVPIDCACGISFCFRCHDYDLGDHSPARCDYIEIWNAKQKSENENLEWLLKNTKKCPKCKTNIEKNGGCMHMTCQKHAGGCGHEFCWLCRGDWSNHGAATGGYYSCNKYSGNESKYDAPDAANAEDAKEYMFFFHRYDSHRKAMEVAKEQLKNAQEKQATVKEVASTDEVKGLERAAQVLLKNRRALQWSYVFAYFLKLGKTDHKFTPEEKEREMALFLYLQEDLEKYTNYLSEVYERDLGEVLGKGKQGYNEWMNEINKLTGVCNKFLTNFNEGIAKGLTRV